MEKFNVRFRKISDDEFKRFIDWSIEDYSKDLIKSSLSTEENALADSKNTYNRLLPDGNYTKDNYMYVIVNDDNEDVGIVWYNKLKDNVAFICQFLILEKFRKHGYGKQSLLLVEEDAKKHGYEIILLNVFKYNTPAFTLYKSINYDIYHEENQAITMVKKIV